MVRICGPALRLWRQGLLQRVRAACEHVRPVRIWFRGRRHGQVAFSAYEPINAFHACVLSLLNFWYNPRLLESSFWLWLFLFCRRRSSIAIGSVHEQEQLNELNKLQFKIFQKIKSMWLTFSSWLFNAFARGISAWVIYVQMDEKSIFAWSLELGASWVHFSAYKSDVRSRILVSKPPGPKIGVWFRNWFLTRTWNLCKFVFLYNFVCMNLYTWIRTP